jgi:hypothetical protein
MTEVPLPTPAEASRVAHDTKNSKGQNSIVRIVRRPTEAQPPEAFTMARMPALTTSGSRSQAATTTARSGGSALESALLLSVTMGFPREIGGLFASCPRHFLHARRAIHGPGGLFFCASARPPARQPCGVPHPWHQTGCFRAGARPPARFNPVPPPGGQLSSVE